MTLELVHNQFRETLKNQYDLNEISNFFFLLADHLMSMSRIQVSLNRTEPLNDEQSAGFMQALKRLKNYEPVQYIIGSTDFYGFEFRVNPSVLIPRPETEELVEWILDDHPGHQETLSVLDIGTGSGCIAISLAKKRPKWQVTALDVSEAALETAAGNASYNKVNVEFLNADIFEPPRFSRGFDIIISNPPYVRDTERKNMMRNVIDFEPSTALFVSNKNPLVYYDAICKTALQYLSQHGKLYLEINENLGEQSVELLKRTGFIRHELRKDFRGKQRMIRAELAKSG